MCSFSIHLLQSKQNSRMPINTQLMKYALKLIYIFSPKLAYLVLKRQLLVPDSESNEWTDDIKKVVLKTKFGNVNTYQYGRGKCVWMLHGWSNAYQFWPLMKKLANQGYSCIAIEIPPHEKSKNIYMSLPKWINAFDTAAKNIHEPVHVITQGLGASVVANSRWFSSYQYDLTLISPVLNYLASLKSYLRKSNIPVSLLTHLVKEAYIADSIHLKDLDATTKVNEFSGRLSIFYSKLDSFTSLNAISVIAKNDNRKVVHFKGATTQKIINSKSIVCAIDAEGECLDFAV